MDPLLNIIEASGGALQSLQQPTLHTFRNPILDSGADPWAIAYGSGYLYTQTAPATAKYIGIRYVKSLEQLGAAEEVRVWEAPARGPYCAQIWAPEIHALGDRWYIYFAASNGSNRTHRMYVLESNSADPLGSYSLRGKLSTEDGDRWAIDGTILSYRDRNYFVWSGWAIGKDMRCQNLYVSAMRTPYALEATRVKISTPQYDWELGALGRFKVGVNEGPTVLQRDGKVFIVYSANGSWCNEYQLGLLELVGDDPLIPEHWVKHPAPVFSSFLATEEPSKSVYGPGHCSFVRAHDEDWMLFHTARAHGSGWDRVVHLQPFGWKNGYPDFGTPWPRSMPIMIPRSRVEGRVCYLSQDSNELAHAALPSNKSNSGREGEISSR